MKFSDRPMSGTRRTSAFRDVLKRTKTSEDLDEVLSSMDASSKYGPLLLQSLKFTGRENVVADYEKHFVETEED